MRTAGVASLCLSGFACASQLRKGVSSFEDHHAKVLHSTKDQPAHPQHESASRVLSSMTPVSLHGLTDPNWDKKSVHANDKYHDDFISDDRPKINQTAALGGSNASDHKNSTGNASFLRERANASSHKNSTGSGSAGKGEKGKTQQRVDPKLLQDQPAHPQDESASRVLSSMTPVSLHGLTDPNWDKKSVQANDKYQDDFTSDDRPKINQTASPGGSKASDQASASSHKDSTGSGSAGKGGGKTAGENGAETSGSDICQAFIGGRSAEWYKNRCAAIDAECKIQDDHLKAMQDAHLKDLRDKLDKQKRTLEDKEKDHSDANDQADQGKLGLEDAKMAVEKNAHCPPELEKARAELAKLQASPNRSPEDIEAECELQKKILELMKCVEKLREAEELLDKLRDDYHRDQSGLRGAADALSPQQKRVGDAQSALDDAIRAGVPGLDALRKRCKTESDALQRLADQDLHDLEAEYLRQKAILEDRAEKHDDEQADVKQQAEVVAKERMHVKEARIVVQENINAPEDLQKERAELASLQAKPNVEPADIDAECEAQKRILDAEDRVEALWEAKGVLSKEKGEHTDEKNAFRYESVEEQVAAQKLPPQQTRVDCAKKAFEEAQAAKKALAVCKFSHSLDSESSSSAGGKTDSGSQSESEKESDKVSVQDEANDSGKSSSEKKTDDSPAREKRPNGAHRSSAVGVAVLALAAALLLALTEA